MPDGEQNFTITIHVRFSCQRAMQLDNEMSKYSQNKIVNYTANTNK